MSLFLLSNPELSPQGSISHDEWSCFSPLGVLAIQTNLLLICGQMVATTPKLFLTTLLKHLHHILKLHSDSQSKKRKLVFKSQF